jgi:hypothetical protein
METDTQRRERSTSDPVADPLPEKTRSIVCHANSFSVSASSIPEEFLEVHADDIDPDDLDPNERIHFERGEEIPLELARSVWDDLGDLFEPIDGHNRTVEEIDEELTQEDESRAYRWS